MVITTIGARAAHAPRGAGKIVTQLKLIGSDFQEGLGAAPLASAARKPSEADSVRISCSCFKDVLVLNQECVIHLNLIALAHWPNYWRTALFVWRRTTLLTFRIYHGVPRKHGTS